MIRVLSTKILSPAQKARILNHGILLDDYNAIRISFRKFSLNLDYDHYIFTSQNAVRGFLRAYDELPLPEKRKDALTRGGFCVGKKTASLLAENGLKVIKIAKNSKELGDFIAKNNQSDSFLFLCGNRRREELPKILNKNTIRYNEVIAYDTLIHSKRFNINYDGVLFFSPSGVQSYVKENKLSSSTAFCIGTSTAKEASLHTHQTVISTYQSIESVIEATLNHYPLNQV